MKVRNGDMLITLAGKENKRFQEIPDHQKEIMVFSQPESVHLRFYDEKMAEPKIVMNADSFSHIQYTQVLNPQSKVLCSRRKRVIVFMSSEDQ